MIDRGKVYAYFDKFFGPVKPSTNDWYTCQCPFCGSRDKFAISLDYLIGKCWKGCYNGYLVEAIKQYHQITYFEARELIDSMPESLIGIPQMHRQVTQADLILPKGYTPILSGDGVMGQRARQYLSGRGFDLNLMDMLGVGYCQDTSENQIDDYFGYIIIPFKKKGQLVYFIGRDYIGNYLRYKNPDKEKYGVGKAELLFNEEALYLQSKVWVTEGWACAATIGRAGVSIQGSIASDYQISAMIKSSTKTLVIIPDIGYYTNGLVMAKRLYEYKKVKVLDLGPLADYGKDVNEIGKEAVMEVEETTPFVDKAFIYKEMRRA